MRRRLTQIAFISFVLVFSAGVIHANSFTFTTPSGSTTSGGAVSATAVVTTNANGTVTIALTNKQANITDVAQAISDFDFVLSNGATTGTLSASSGQQITIASGGTATLGSTVATGWGINNNVSGGIQLDALGFVGPAGLIVGPAGTGGVFTAANSSIAGNGPHNPFINQTANFTITVAGVTASTNVTSATFSFGTTAGVNVPGTPTTTPEPGTIMLFGSGLLGVAGIIRRKIAGQA
jgi:hypothetical protein